MYANESQDDFLEETVVLNQSRAIPRPQSVSNQHLEPGTGGLEPLMSCLMSLLQLLRADHLWGIWEQQNSELENPDLLLIDH